MMPSDIEQPISDVTSEALLCIQQTQETFQKPIKRLAKGFRSLTKKDWQNIVIWAVFCVYLWLLIWVITLKANSVAVLQDSLAYKNWPLAKRLGKSYIPFYTLIQAIKGDHSIVDHILNIIIYLPMGIYLFLFLKKPWQIISVIMASTVLFELIQLFSGVGGFDATDICLNGLGGMLGYALISWIPIADKRSVSAKVSFVAFFLFLPLAVYALVNTVEHIELYKGLFYAIL